MKKEMYKGMVNSPQTGISQDINESVTDIPVENGSVFPKGPNLAVIGTDQHAETIRYTSVNSNILVGCTRGFEGVAKSWDSGTPIARNITQYDIYSLQENLKEVDSNKVEKVENKGLSTEDYTTEEKEKLGGIEKGANKYTHPETHSPEIIKETEEKQFISKTEKESIKNKVDKDGNKVLSTNDYTDTDKQEVAKIKNKVDKVSGKGLSTNDFTNNHKAKVDAIPENPKYTDTIATKESVGLGKVKNEEQATKEELEAHKLETIDQGEVHGIRLNIDKKLEYFNGEEWIELKGGGYPVNIVKNVAVAKEDDGMVALTWQDPEDVIIDGTTVAKWKTTKVMRKVGSYPKHEEDGELVVSSGVRNQYKTEPYVDGGLINDTEYFYSLFPITEDEVVTLSDLSRVSATPVDIDDTTGSPGSAKLIGGDMQAGFFGEVPSSEFITGDALARLVGITAGTSQHSNGGWLKFAYKGKVQFVCKKPIRCNISWDNINSANAVYGNKQVTIKGQKYKVRLMRGANEKTQPNPDTSSGFYNGAANHKSEWNKLMLPIHEQAKDGSWAHKGNVESGVLNWGVGYTDADLLTHRSHGNGSYSWCQELAESASYRMYRGYNGVSFSSSGSPSVTRMVGGWRACLELVGG